MTRIISGLFQCDRIQVEVFQCVTCRILAKGISWALCAFLAIGTVGCRRDSTVRPTDASGPVRVGVLPDQAPEVLEARYAPLLDHLRDSVGRDFDLVIPANYSELVDLFQAGQLELAWFGGVTFTRASELAEAVPLVLRDVDLEFTSDVLVSARADGDRIEDFKGGSLAFGPRLSTSGHMMPRFFLVRDGIDPEEFFEKVEFSNGHDQTAAWVQAGRVDLGVVNSVVVKSMFEDGRLDPAKVRILSTTPPYRNYVWAVPPYLDGTLRTALLNAFLALDRNTAEHASVLERLGANAFFPASQSLYSDLREAARILQPALNGGAP